jgi:phage baseplate assembly protein W
MYKNEKIKYPIGIMVPIKMGTNGYFEQSFDTFTQIKQNLTHLLKTKKGELRFNSEFGCRLDEVVFDQHDVNTSEIIKNILTSDIQRWIPEVIITKLHVKSVENTDFTDNYYVSIVIEFKVRNIDKLDTIELTIKP